MSLNDPQNKIWMQLGLSLVFHLCFSLYISLILSSQFLPNDWKSSCLQLPYSHFSFLTPKRVCITSLSANSKRSKGMIKIEPYFIISSAQTSSPLAESRVLGSLQQILSVPISLQAYPGKSLEHCCCTYLELPPSLCLSVHWFNHMLGLSVEQTASAES